MADYRKYAEEIVEWNRLSKGEDFSLEALKQQGIFIEQEFNELLGAIAIDPNMNSSFVAEACDLFVVSSYYYYMKHGFTYYCTPIKQEVSELIADIDSFISAKCYDECIDLVWDLLYSLPRSKEILEAKLLSNWTKIPLVPLVSEFCSKDNIVSILEKEAKDIEERFKGRYNGVTFQLVAGDRVVFKDQNNKVLKPSTYKGWEHFLK